jgi:arabinofuranosyltransferase
MPIVPEPIRNKAGTLLAWVLLFVLAAVVLRSAWVCEDAYISFRTVDNLVSGHGLTWNTAERVQTFTNPLWVLIVSAAYLATGDVYYTSILLSVLLTMVAAALLVHRMAASTRSAALAVMVLVGSKAFVDYSTSGLENPLTHLLLAVFFLLYLGRTPGPRTLFALCLVAALAAVNRLDSLLLYLPALVATYAGVPKRKGALYALAGFAPLVAWELFSLVYYGFPFPNTYYAKLHAGIPRSEMIVQGLVYLIDSLDRDPITLVAVAASCAGALVARSRRLAATLIGAVLYLCYVIWIGGDFMSGRFLSAPLLVAAMTLCRLELPETGPGLFAPLAIAAALALAAPLSPLTADSSYGSDGQPVVNWRGIADERGYYYQTTGLLLDSRDKRMPNHPWVADGLRLKATGTRVERRGAIGFAGFAAGPEVRLLDTYGLGDPLMARLHIGSRRKWRIGHFERLVPQGYFETLESEENRIEDPSLAEYYDALSRIVSGPIWSAQRFGLIVGMNTGRYDHLVDKYHENLPGPPTVGYGAASAPRDQGTPWNAAGNRILRDDGIVVKLPTASRCAAAELSVDHNDDYELDFLDGRAVVSTLSVPRKLIASQGLRVDQIVVPAEAVQSGYDAVSVRPVAGDGRYSVGHLRLLCPQ